MIQNDRANENLKSGLDGSAYSVSAYPRGYYIYENVVLTTHLIGESIYHIWPLLEMKYIM